MIKPKTHKRKKREASSTQRTLPPQNPHSQEKLTSATQADFGARVSRRAADRLRAGHVWVYSSDIEFTELAAASAEPPALLPVADYRGVLLGTALYSPTSQIALRLISREAIRETEWLNLLQERLKAAIERRMAALQAPKGENDSCRLCFSEADELPGLVIDKYDDLVIVQLLTKGLDSPAVRDQIVSVLREQINPSTILERPDPRIRELEGMSAPSPAPLYAVDPAHPLTATQFQLNGLKFHYDANAGQKTGAFLDQHANYKAAADWARILSPGGRALDVCTYQGGFALHLARVSNHVTGIDSSRASLEVAERNLAANRDQLRSNVQVDWLEADAFTVLRDWAAAKERFDTIVLDPPAFAKSKRAVEGALRGYKELNLRAMQMLKPHGLLVTCSCSHHVSLSDFEAIVAAAAADAHRRVRLLERRGAAPDHPVILNIPETEYLKCLILEVE
ncbi:class I SAM-dependent rRNA methyltransferase [Occallatibacter savannae]|uniref:class I SAM-dependent rRNA methyltransferase n=1 Tax=Occallatibacter savannae TaxID=1002691 RepID=UPI000D6894DE|nr:class I SAM-dependent rRNA methyltransferase [Occallatibacter savannae]